MAAKVMRSTRSCPANAREHLFAIAEGDGSSIELGRRVPGTKKSVRTEHGTAAQREASLQRLWALLTVGKSEPDYVRLIAGETVCLSFTKRSSIHR